MDAGIRTPEASDAVEVELEPADVLVNEQSQTATRTGPLSRIQRHPIQFGLLLVAAVLLIASMFMPYWEITLHAPQYPKGLTVEAFVNRLEGDVREVDGLNHYIGMMKLEDAAKLERAVSMFAIPLLALAAIGVFFVRGRMRWLLAAPVIAYPFVFVADLFAWLYYAGHSLDPGAALSSSIKPFTPRILGVGVIGQFHTDARFMIGFYMAVAAMILVVVATLMLRKAHDPDA